MAEETIKKTFVNPYRYVEEGNFIELELFSLEEGGLGNWSNKHGYFSILGYNLGPFWVNFGKLMQKYVDKDLTKVKVILPEKGTVIFLSWLIRLVLGPNIPIEFVDVQNKTKEKFLLGEFDDIIDVNLFISNLTAGKYSIRQLRELVEIVAAGHLVVADALYQIDFGTDIEQKSKYLDGDQQNVKMLGKDLVKKSNKITSWQSYGRWEIRDFRERAIKEHVKSFNECILIPCTITKPYYGNLNNINPTLNDMQTNIKKEIAKKDKDVIVMTTIGVAPMGFWEDPIDLGYDVRVPDLWADYLSMKKFFQTHKYDKVYCWLNYNPYIEMVCMLRAYGIIPDVEFVNNQEINLTKKGGFGAFFALPQSSK